MLELTAKNTRIYEKGSYLFEVAPDGVTVKPKKAKGPLQAADLINIGDWLIELAHEVKEHEEDGTCL